MEAFIYETIFTVLILVFIFDTYISVLNYKNRKEPIPLEVNDIYEKDEYTKWLSYTMENFRLGKISSSLSLVLIIGLLLSGFFVHVHEVSVDLFSSETLQILFFLFIYFVLSFIIGLFFSYYSNFSIEKRYGFNKMTKITFVKDKIKSFILTIVFGGGLISLLIFLFDISGPWFVLTSMIAMTSIMLFINLFYVKLIVPIFNKLTPLEDSTLKTEIIAFASGVGYEVNKISVIDASKRSTKLNAFFSGFGKMKQVVLYDTLIEKMSEGEIVAVLGHEIGHSKLKHIPKMIFTSIFNILIYMGILIAMLNIDEFSTAFGFDEVNFGFVLIVFVIILSPISIIIGWVNNRSSRKHEFEADKFAASRGYKTEMEGALKVITKENFGNLTPHKLFVQLYYSHPPVAERIREIRKIK
ncbi:MAG: M48 family metallopeptidase [Candidatus Izemoplasma sp.]